MRIATMSNGIDKERLLKYLENLHNDLHRPPYEKCHKNSYCRKAYNQIVGLMKKPTVTEKFVDRMVNGSVYVLHQDRHKFYKKMLRGAGVEIRGKKNE